ncbi:MAG: adenylate kinase [Planctomycetota bacterium]|nr:MAG: adenylate kinase [Planctomycetota bacterium]
MPFSGMHRPQVVLLFGPPGAGKGTIGQMICAAGNHFHLSSGNIFRHLSPESKNGQLFHEYAGKGKLVPDEVTFEVWKKYTRGLVDTNRYFPGQQLLLLDGIPRTTKQAEMLDQFVDILHIIVLDIFNEDVILKRILRRAQIEKRSDDAEESVIRKRIEEYHTKTSEVLKHYDKEKVFTYSAENRPIEVLRDVLVGSAFILKTGPLHIAPPDVSLIEPPPIP